jgi:iron complex transport system substrate-binding protein
VNLRPERLADVWEDVARVAAAIGLEAAGMRTVAALERRVATIAGRAAALAGRPAVLSIEWIEPVMIGGLWMPELIELGGGAPLVTSPGDHAPTLSRETLAELDPDVVLVKPCGFSLERTFEELDSLRGALPWDAWRAVREGRVYMADGNAYFNRPGPRLVESLEIVAACAHPEAFADFRVKHRDSVVRIDRALARHPFDARP